MLFDIPRFYISVCSYSVQYVRLHPIPMSIVFHHYKELTECIKQVQKIEAKVEGRSSSTTTKERKRRGRPSALPPTEEAVMIPTL